MTDLTASSRQTSLQWRSDPVLDHLSYAQSGTSKHRASFLVTSMRRGSHLSTTLLTAALAAVAPAATTLLAAALATAVPAATTLLVAAVLAATVLATTLLATTALAGISLTGTTLVTASVLAGTTLVAATLLATVLPLAALPASAPAVARWFAPRGTTNLFLAKRALNRLCFGVRASVALALSFSTRVFAV